MYDVPHDKEILFPVILTYLPSRSPPKAVHKKHWLEDEENFEHPVVPNEEKAVIRELLLLSLDVPHGKICTAVGMAVASIAHCYWPDLLVVILKLINDQTNMSAVRGVLKCLALIAGDLDDTSVPTLVPVLFTCFCTIVSSPQTHEKVYWGFDIGGDT